MRNSIYRVSVIDVLILILISIRGAFSFGFYLLRTPRLKQMEFNDTIQGQDISKDVRKFTLRIVYSLYLNKAYYSNRLHNWMRRLSFSEKTVTYKNYIPLFTECVYRVNRAQINAGIPWLKAKEYSDFIIKRQYQYEDNSELKKPNINACLYILDAEWKIGLEDSINIHESDWITIKNTLKFVFPFLCIRDEPGRTIEKISALHSSSFTVRETWYVRSWVNKVGYLEKAIDLAYHNEKFEVARFLEKTKTSFIIRINKANE